MYLPSKFPSLEISKTENFDGKYIQLSPYSLLSFPLLEISFHNRSHDLPHLAISATLESISHGCGTSGPKQWIHLTCGLKRWVICRG